MAREKEFDQESVIRKARDLFWERGFGGTSLQDLLKHTGLSRQSFYNSFGSKEGMFVEVLKLYRGRFNERLEALFEPDADLETIRSFFDYYLFSVAPLPERQCCLMGRAAVELGQQQDGTAFLIEEHFLRLHLGFEKALRNAGAKGQLNRDAAVKDLAHSLVALAQGIGVMARAGLPNRDLQRAVRGALRAMGEQEQRLEAATG